MAIRVENNNQLKRQKPYQWIQSFLCRPIQLHAMKSYNYGFKKILGGVTHNLILFIFVIFIVSICYIYLILIMK